MKQDQRYFNPKLAKLKQLWNVSKKILVKNRQVIFPKTFKKIFPKIVKSSYGFALSISTICVMQIWVSRTSTCPTRGQQDWKLCWKKAFYPSSNKQQTICYLAFCSWCKRLTIDHFNEHLILKNSSLTIH